jgi:hypothetical protein
MFEKYVIVHNHYYKYIFWLCMNKAIFLLCVRHIPKHNPKQAWTDLLQTLNQNYEAEIPPK